MLPSSNAKLRISRSRVKSSAQVSKERAQDVQRGIACSMGVSLRRGFQVLHIYILCRHRQSRRGAGGGGGGGGQPTVYSSCFGWLGMDRYTIIVLLTLDS